MNTFWNKKLLAGMFVTGALVASGSASAAVLCSSLATTDAWQAAGTCFDADGDTAFTFDSYGGNFAGIGATTGLVINEVTLLGGNEFYNVGFDFAGGYAGGGSLTYSVTALGTERFAASSFDTTIVGTGTHATKQLSDRLSGNFLTLTSDNGAHDPLGGGTTPFAPKAGFQVVDTFASTSTGLFLHSDNAFVAVQVPEPETYAMLLAGLGLVGFVARRRKQKAD